MDRTEILAKAFLEQLGHTDLTYEPDGNVPPDFLLGDGTAVEVRRLNQIHTDAQGNVQGLETADVALWRTMQSLVASYQSSLSTTTSYGVFYQFGRPIPARRVIERELNAEFDQFLSGDRDISLHRKLPCGIGIRLFDWGIWKGTPFRLGGSMDHQRGGWVVAQLSTAIRNALLDKEAKVKQFKPKYPRWWLVLLDQVSWGTDENDRRQLQATGPFTHSFDRVFVVNDQRLDDYFEL